MGRTFSKGFIGDNFPELGQYKLTNSRMYESKDDVRFLDNY